MNTREMQDEIIRLKKEKDICILAHAYQSHNIWEVADFVGDSFALSKKAAEAKENTMLMCGVRFMAETVKTLSPQKKVILANPDADCPMAHQMSRLDVAALKEKHPDAVVVAYINTTAELKCSADIIVTSSSAVDILKKVPEKKIIFIPDCNLGAYVAKSLPEKEFIFVKGGCPTHLRVQMADVEIAKESHPSAELLVHPECRIEICESADYVGSTTGIISYAEKSDKKEFIIGTENSIIEHLQFSCPDKKFYALSRELVCHNMKLTTLGDIYNCVKGCGGEEIFLSDEIISSSLKPIEKMISLGG